MFLKNIIVNNLIFPPDPHLRNFDLYEIVSLLQTTLGFCIQDNLYLHNVNVRHIQCAFKSCIECTSANK